MFDVSRWKGPNTWLVCFEDLDAGDPITPCCSGTDDDYNDFVFQVTALGATPARTLSFGALKTRYRWSVTRPASGSPRRRPALAAGRRRIRSPAC